MRLEKSFVGTLVITIIGYLVLSLFLFLLFVLSQEYHLFVFTPFLLKTILFFCFLIAFILICLSRYFAIFNALLLIQFFISFCGMCTILAVFIWIALLPLPVYMALIFINIISISYSFYINMKKLDIIRSEKKLKKLQIIDIEKNVYNINLWGKKVEFLKNGKNAHPIINKIQGGLGLVLISSNPILLGVSFGLGRLGFENARWLLISLFAYIVGLALPHGLLPNICLLRIIHKMKKESGKKVKVVYI